MIGRPVSSPGQEAAVVRLVGREALAFLANFIACLGVFYGISYFTQVRGSEVPGEASEGVAIMMMLYVPMMFTLAYCLARAVLYRAWSARWLIGTLRPGFWVVGALLGAAFSMLASHTRFFWILNPIVRLLGV